jgi:DNA-binding NarL/FixJ family response regulator
VEWLTKRSNARTATAAVRRLWRHAIRRAVQVALVDRLVDRACTARTESDGLDELTAREREVLGLVATGLTNAEIADALQLSPLTAKTHVSRILMKLGARDRVQLVVIAYQSGIVEV